MKYSICYRNSTITECNSSREKVNDPEWLIPQRQWLALGEEKESQLGYYNSPEEAGILIDLSAGDSLPHHMALYPSYHHLWMLRYLWILSILPQSWCSLAGLTMMSARAIVTGTQYSIGKASQETRHCCSGSMQQAPSALPVLSQYLHQPPPAQR